MTGQGGRQGEGTLAVISTLGQEGAPATVAVRVGEEQDLVTDQIQG